MIQSQLGMSALVISAVFLGLATVFVALRFVSRIFVTGNVALSDYVMLAAWVLACSLSVAIFIAATRGLGLKGGVPPEWARALAKTQYAFMVLYVGSTTVSMG
jgi:hypothetical protein